MKSPKKVDADTKMLDIGFDALKLAQIDIYKKLLGFGGVCILINSILRIINLCFCTAMLVVGNRNIASVTKFIKAASGLSQGYAKLIVPMFYSNDLIAIRTQVAKFWGKTNEIKDDYIPLYRMLKLYKYAMCTTFIFMCIQAVIVRDVLFPVYIPNSTLTWILLLFSQYIQVTFDLFYVVAMDGIYMASCGIIWRQYKLLGEAFHDLSKYENLDEKRKRFRDCVDHHNFLLEYIAHIRRAHNFPFMMQYMISVGGICIEFYNVSEGLDFLNLILFFMYTSAILFQLVVFCFPADLTEEAAFKFSQALYNFDWQNTPLDIQKCIPLVLSEAQKEVTFTAGGLIKINKEAFTIIFKTAMSFMTFMKQMSDK